MTTFVERASARVLAILAAFAVVLAGALLAVSPASAAGTGSISGVVSDEGGSPIAGVSVTALHYDAPSDSWIGPTTTTGPDGSYTVAGLDDGDYRVSFSPTTTDYLPEYWNDATTADQATLVSVAGDVTGIDPVLTTASSLAGVVTDTSGTPVPDVDVVAYLGATDGSTWDVAGSAPTDANGGFRIGGLAAGTYKLQYSTDSATANVLGTWWGGPNVDAAAPVTVGHAAALTGFDAQLALGAAISGTVVEASGHGIPGATVVTQSADVFLTTSTDDNGAYTFSHLPPGTYQVGFSSSTGDYLPDWWEHASSWNAATPLNLAAGDSLTGIDGHLAPAGVIQGTVTDTSGQPVQGVSVNVIGATQDLYSATTDASGAYRVGALPAGQYTVQFDGSTASSDVESGWWNGAADAAHATVLTVAEGATVSNISPQLAPGASISGHVVDGANTALSGVAVYVYRGNDQDQPTLVQTDANGDFSAHGLSAGDYRLQLVWSAQPGTTLTEWWDNAQSFTDAQPIALTAGQAVSHIDVKLSVDDHSVRDTHSASLSGVVRDADGKPLSGVQVDVIDAANTFGDGTATGADGTWTMGSLSAHSYKVRFTATINGQQVVEYWNDASDLAGATVITLADGEHKTRISAIMGVHGPRDIPLAPTPTVTGIAKNGQTLTAVPGTWTAGTTLTYQWFTGSTPITGATAKTLVLAAEDVGTRISVRVTGSLDPFQATSRTSSAVGPVAGATLATSTPVISGSAVVGSTLTAKPGTWTTGTALTYTWLADGTAITGATASTLVVAPAQVGKKLSVRVTGTKTGYVTTATTSAATAAVQPGTLVAGTPTISGTVVVGGTVTAKPGTWSPAVTFHYQWLADGKAIGGATGATYKIASSITSKRLSVRVTGTRAGYTTVAKTSASTARVPLAGTPSISGAAVVGATLTAKPGTWTAGTSFAYQWFVDGAAIVGANKATYKVASGATGKALTVRVTGGKSGYPSIAKTSSPTARVPRVGKPSISGLSYVTGTLTAVPGAWTSGTTYAYKWLLNGAAIPGATKSTLSVSASYNGKRISVQVTGRKAGYTTVVAGSGTVTIKPGKAKPASKFTCPPGYPIKGNQTTRHSTDWIYHVPGGQYYNATAPEECFATEAAARQAGYRKSLR